MEPWQSDSIDFDKKLQSCLEINNLKGLSTDQEFLQKLNQNLSSMDRISTTINWSWVNGICRGLAAASIGVILFIGLQVLSPILLSASLSGTELIKTKIADVTLNHTLWWQKIGMDLGKLK